MKTRVLIADDEALARQRLRDFLDREADIQVVAECADGREALREIRNLRPDLVFLDVKMPELDGFGVLETLNGDLPPAIVFVTAFGEYSLEAFEAQAVDYLLKPFDRERFQRALERARTWIGRKHSAPDGPGEAPPPGFADRFLVRAGDRQVLLRTQAIQWVESEDNYVRLHAQGGDYLLRQTMAGLLARLDPRQFRRIHRTAIVNLDAIQEIQPWTGGDHLVLMKDGAKLTLSRTYRTGFAEGW